jgi:hypothetical protein
MVKSAENRMRSNLELLPVMNVKSRPQYISALKKVVPDISRPKKSRHYFDALNERTVALYDPFFRDHRATDFTYVKIGGIVTRFKSELSMGRLMIGCKCVLPLWLFRFIKHLSITLLYYLCKIIHILLFITTNI